MCPGALMSWVVRPPRWVSLFQVLMIVSATLATATSFWPVLAENVAGSAAAIVIAALLGVILFAVRKKLPGTHIRKPRSVERVAASHWRVVFHDGSSTNGRLCHAWRGWAWHTLRIQSPDSHNALEFTVWRATVSAVSWHQLQVWTAWELAMTRPGQPRRHNVEPF